MCVQIRGIEEVSAVSVLGTLGMLVALTIAASKICLAPRPDSYRYGCSPSKQMSPKGQVFLLEIQK